MPGLVYIDTNSSTVMLTHEIYFNCPDQYKKLRIRTGTANVSDTIGYPLTSDTSASGYSPLAILYTNNKVCYIATYSTGSSSASGTYKYTIQSGYEQYTTGRTARTVQRAGQQTDEYYVTSTEQYKHHDNIVPGETYYSASNEYYTTSKKTWFADEVSREWTTEGYDPISHTRKSLYSSEYYTQRHGGNRTGKYASSWRSESIKNNNPADLGVESSYSQVMDYKGYTHSRVYRTAGLHKYTQARYTTITRVDGYVSIPGQTIPVYSVKTVTETKTTYYEGVTTVTTGWDYGYSSRYTEKTSTSSNDAGDSWTHSNINIL